MERNKERGHPWTVIDWSCLDLAGDPGLEGHTQLSALNAQGKLQRQPIKFGYFRVFSETGLQG